jgi:DNA-binding response OmpR family regulator
MAYVGILGKLMGPVQRIAIVIEPKPMLADLVAEALQRMGYEVAIAATHIGGAAEAAAYGRVDLGVVAIGEGD